MRTLPEGTGPSESGPAPARSSTSGTADARHMRRTPYATGEMCTTLADVGRRFRILKPGGEDTTAKECDAHGASSHLVHAQEAAGPGGGSGAAGGRRLRSLLLAGRKPPVARAADQAR